MISEKINFDTSITHSSVSFFDPGLVTEIISESAKNTSPICNKDDSVISD